MTSDSANPFASSGNSFDCGDALLGKLGRELSYVYQDVIESPLPDRLQRLVEMLDDALSRGREAGSEAD